MKRALLIAMLALSDAITPACATSFIIQHNGTPAPAQAAIAHAADIWSSILVSSVPVKVTVNWTSLMGLALGITLPNGERDFIGAPQADTWYPTALANSIAGIELNPGEADFDIWIDSGTDWYTGTDGNTPAGQYDLVSIMLHEMGHGLGIVGLAKKSGAIGSFGALTAADFAPLATDFPWPTLDSLPGIFDRFVEHALYGPLTAMTNGSTPLGAAFTSGQLFFSGTVAVAANGGSAPQLYAPSTFALGSSCVHLDEAAFPAGGSNELMTPFSSAGDAVHWPGPVAIGILVDIGWAVTAGSGLPQFDAAALLIATPNPAADHVTITCDNSRLSTVRILDARGAIACTASAVGPIDVSGLSPGLYQAIVSDGVRDRGIRIMKQ